MSIQQLHLKICRWIDWFLGQGQIESVFPFLLAQADQGDLKEVKRHYVYEQVQEFSKAIDEAYDVLLKAPYKVLRHDRP